MWIGCRALESGQHDKFHPFTQPVTSISTNFATLFQRIVEDPRYQRNLDWGVPRSGHPEGTVRAHIAELESNLERLKPRLSVDDVWKLKLLIHTHDSFKADAKPGVAIADPASHASLARSFLAEFCSDEDLLAMVQYHDESFSLWRQVQFKGAYNPQRMDALIERIKDWNLFLAFHIIDACTPGKSRDPIRWLFAELKGKVQSGFTEADIIE
jgi:hypothetical protein